MFTLTMSSPESPPGREGYTVDRYINMERRKINPMQILSRAVVGKSGGDSGEVAGFGGRSGLGVFCRTVLSSLLFFKRLLPILLLDKLIYKFL